MKRSLFIFRRDLRVEDNTALTAALRASDEVILSFIFTPEQIESNPFKSNSALQFMIESLEDLNHAIEQKGGKLYFFYGKPEATVEECIQKLRIEAVYVNNDYTPYSIKRDKKIEAVCSEYSIEFHGYDDLMLHPIENILKKDGNPYTVFTPYFKNASLQRVSKPQYTKDCNFFNKSIPFSKDVHIVQNILSKRRKQAPGGRLECLKILKNIASFAHYKDERDYPALNKTTHLSAHLKFNTCSTREIYFAIAEKLGPASDLLRALYWRDFFTLIGLNFPHVFKGAFKAKYDMIKWSHNKERFMLWCEGKTGFPIVDAGMRELNETGFMHNRVRMIVASFLTKDLHIHWQWGEKYFAQHLIDYDPAVNNGNWQWSSSTGCDAQPYFRIFNPWSQSKKFDPECTYIKTWVPELQGIAPQVIHNFFEEKYSAFNRNYPRPIVDHSKESPKALDMFRQVAGSEEEV
jgi:deoxyribodipyrimidine photo-lyase